MQVKDFMKRPYIIDHDMKLSEAAKIMSAKKIGSLVFVSKNRIKGILTANDILKNYGQAKRISKIMSKNIIKIGPSENIDLALRLMRENKLKRLLVIDDKKSLVGIVSMIDIAANSENLTGEFFFN